MDRRPWRVSPDVWDVVMEAFPMWLREREGIIVYENENFDSSAFGDQTFVPAMCYVEGSDRLKPAPKRLGNLPSNFQYQADHIKLEEFDGDTDLAIRTCFVREEK